MRKRVSLRQQVIIMLLGCIFLPITFMTVFIGHNVKIDTENKFQNSAVNSMGRISEVINGIDKSCRESEEMLAIDPNVLDMLKDPACEQWLLKSFNSFISTHKDVINVYYGLNNGKFIVSPKQDIPSDYDPRNRAWYKEAVKADGKAILTDPYEDALQKGRFMVTYAKVVKDAQSGQALGVVGIDIALSTLSKEAIDMKIGEGGYLTILDKNGKIIADKDPKKFGKDAKDEKWIDSILKSKDVYTNQVISGVNYRAFSSENKTTGWKIVGFVPESEIKAKAYSEIILNGVISIIVLVVAMIIGIVFSKTLTDYLNDLVKVLRKVSEGDFSHNIEKKKNINKEIELIIDAVNNMINDMVLILKNVVHTSSTIRTDTQDLVTVAQEASSVGEEVSRAIQQISEGVTEQAASLDYSANIVSKLGEKVNAALLDANKMMQSSDEVKKSTDEGILVLENLRNNFDQTFNANKELASDVETLNQNSNKIGAITDTIREITEQTNLLALNASIEAARAGEAGKGFAVVAEEVRKLAEQSSHSAAEINKVILEMNGSVKTVLDKIQYIKELNDVTEKNVGITQSSFENIESTRKALGESINRVSDSLEIINSNKDEVVSKISEIASVAEETAATTEEVSASSQEQTAGLCEVVSSTERLKSLSDELDDIIKKFKISND